MNKIGILTTFSKSEYEIKIIEELNKREIKDFKNNIFVEYTNKENLNIGLKNLFNKGVDFLILEDLTLFENFDSIQESSDLVILNPIDTVSSYLIGELDRFPLWTLKASLGAPLLDRYNIGYQVLDRDSKKVFSEILISEKPFELIKSEILKYKPFGIDSVIINSFKLAEVLGDSIEDISVYDINSLYIKKSVDILLR